MIKKIEFQSGQAIILVVLLLMVALTVGLAVTTRTTTDLSMSRQLEQSQRAFSAAEAGIEIALISSALDSGEGSAGSATFRYVVKDTGTEEFIFPAINASCADNVCEDDSFQLWLKNETESYGSNRIKIAWGVSSSSEKPSIEIAALYKEGIDYKIKRWAFDPDQERRGSGFSSINNSSFTIAGTGFKYSTDLDLPSGVGIENLLIRGKLFYTKNNKVGFKSLDGGTFPKQGKLIESTGTDQGTTRKIEVFSGHPILPGLFDYAIFSKDGLIGNE